MINIVYFLELMHHGIIKRLLSVSTFDGLGYSFIIKENGDKIVDSSNKTSIKFSNFFDDIGANFKRK